MKKVYLRNNKGITLIALVITIIVLLILAGVAIAMLSGENGILKKAAEAKTKTEKSQDNELQKLTGYEMIIDKFQNKDIGIKWNDDGTVTGIKFDAEDKRAPVKKVKGLEESLEKYGCKISVKYNDRTKKDEEIKEEEKENIDIATGMGIEKDGKIIARIVIFGDVNCDGVVDADDALLIQYYYNYDKIELTDFQIKAANANEDDEINEDDSLKVQKFTAFELDGEALAQDREEKNVKIRRIYKKLHEYIAKLDESTGYSLTYNEEEDTYKLKGTKNGTKVEELVSVLPDSSKVKIVDKDGKEIENGTNIKDGDYVKYDGAKFAYIEVN